MKCFTRRLVHMMLLYQVVMFSFTFVVLLIASTSAAVVEVEVDSVTAKTTTSPPFLAQG